jgi:hypothetical protein
MTATKRKPSIAQARREALANKQQLEACALHEAGHGVLAEAAGLRVKWATISNTIFCDGPHCKLEDRNAGSDAHKLLVDFAGMAADLEGGSRFSTTAYAHDIKLAGRHRQGLTESEISAALDGARKILREFWPAVEEVARKMLEQTTVTGAEIREIIARTSAPAAAKRVIVWRY